jgi:hypothetical protein
MTNRVYILTRYHIHILKIHNSSIVILHHKNFVCDICPLESRDKRNYGFDGLLNIHFVVRTS